jgi:hypothetical protein
MPNWKRVKYWKKVAFSIVTKIALHSYIQYEESYQGQRKLKAKLLIHH